MSWLGLSQCLQEEVVFITEILSSGSLKDFIKKVQVGWLSMYQFSHITA